MTAEVRTLRRGRRLLKWGGYMLFVVVFLYGLAHTPPAIQFAWKQARGTPYQPDVIRWQLSIYGEPVEKALARERIRPDQPVDEVIATYGPFRVRTAGRYQTLEPPGNWVGSFEGYQMIAQDGRLKAAAWWTCTGDIEFFNTLTVAETAEFEQAYERSRRQAYLDRIAPRMAVAGSLGYLQPVPPEGHDAPGQPTGD